jgi:5-methylcytosine-specific restriction endonuclease McrA
MVYQSRLYRYPRLWSKGIIQRHLLEWADHKCECCGADRDDVSLHVHHLIWRDKHDCRFENLLVCCVGCHTRLHNRKWQPGQPWLPDWGAVPEWLKVRNLEHN